uniref:Uncharacterized protein n=1 Tax=Falco tinnunculus TaxID=100819 RepID=A0A8C4TUV5_FALTI
RLCPTPGHNISGKIVSMLRPWLTVSAAWSDHVEVFLRGAGTCRLAVINNPFNSSILAVSGEYQSLLGLSLAGPRGCWRRGRAADSPCMGTGSILA